MVRSTAKRANPPSGVGSRTMGSRSVGATRSAGAAARAAASRLRSSVKARAAEAPTVHAVGMFPSFRRPRSAQYAAAGADRTAVTSPGSSGSAASKLTAPANRRLASSESTTARQDLGCIGSPMLRFPPSHGTHVRPTAVRPGRDRGDPKGTSTARPAKSAGWHDCAVVRKAEGWTGTRTRATTGDRPAARSRASHPVSK